MLLLFAVYALRISEVTNLRLIDIDWVVETLTVRRMKNGLVQVFPLQYEVGEALLLTSLAYDLVVLPLFVLYVTVRRTGSFVSPP